MSASPRLARPSRVERPALIAARLFSMSSPCFSTCRATRNSTADRSPALEIPAGDEMIGHGPRLVVSPRLKGGEKLPLVDQAILKREDPEEQVSR